MLRAFPEHLSESERVLYRLETNQKTALRLPILVQSQFEPNWMYLENSDLLLQSVQIKCFEPKFKAGQILAFRLLANPTKRLKQSGKRVGIYNEERLHQWLERKAQMGGFNLLSVNMQKQGMLSGVKYQEKEKHSLKHYGVLFEGELRVRDPQAFTYALRQGIGSGKGFGFGLLSVAFLR